MMKPLTCISVFSGCGGLDLGLESAGFHTVVACDADPACARTYRQNFPSASFVEGKLEDVLDSYIAMAKEYRAVDLLAGGPPCPPFSKSRFWRTDMPRGFDDPKGEQTFISYLDVLRAIRPKAFLLENVRGLTYKGHKDALDFLLESAEGMGYACTWQVINAADYGVPQIRERCFVIGVQGGNFEFPAPTHSKQLDPERMPWVTAGTVLNDLDTEEAANDYGHAAGGRFRHLLEQIPPGDNYLYFTAERGHPEPQFKWRSRYWSYLLKLSPDLPSWTIQAKRSNNMGPLHWRNRILRLEEVKRLQTFPDSFALCGDVNQKWRQIGNAVPPLLAEKLGLALKESITQRIRKKVA